MSKEWAILQDDFLRDRQVALDPRHSAGEFWCIQILAVLWEQWTFLWTARNNSKSIMNKMSVGDFLTHDKDFRIQVNKRLRVFRDTIDLIVGPRVRNEWLRTVDLAVPKGSKVVKNLIEQYEPIINDIIQKAKEKRDRKFAAKRPRSKVMGNDVVGGKVEARQYQSRQSPRSKKGRSKKRKRSSGS